MLDRIYISCETSVNVYDRASRRLCRYIAMRLQSGPQGSQRIALTGPDFISNDARVVTLLAERELHTMAVTMNPRTRVYTDRSRGVLRRCVRCPTGSQNGDDWQG